jgi:hypothetical protein
MKKHEIRVTIDSKEKQQKAIQILNRYNETIFDNPFAMWFNDEENSLKCDFESSGGDWFVSFPCDGETEITLDELEIILKNESK